MRIAEMMANLLVSATIVIISAMITQKVVNDKFGKKEKMAYDNNMTGMIFRNDQSKLDRNPKMPMYSGKVEVEGIDLHAGLWVRTSKRTGKKFFSIVLSYPDGEKRRLTVSGEEHGEEAKGSEEDVPITSQDLDDLEPPDEDLPF